MLLKLTAKVLLTTLSINTLKNPAVRRFVVRFYLPIGRLAPISLTMMAAVSALLVNGLTPVLAAEPSQGADSAALSTSTASISPAKLALLKELCDLLAPGKNAEESLNVTFAQQEKQLSTILNAMSARGPAGATAEEGQKLKEAIISRQMKILKRTQELFREKIDLNSLCNTIYVSIYNKHFDEKQLKDLISFYKSPTGSHFREVQTAIVDEAMAMTSRDIQSKIIAISKQVESELRPEVIAPAGAAPAAPQSGDKAKPDNTTDKK